jgi:hypothetical protein
VGETTAGRTPVWTAARRRHPAPTPPPHPPTAHPCTLQYNSIRISQKGYTIGSFQFNRRFSPHRRRIEPTRTRRPKRAGSSPSSSSTGSARPSHRTPRTPRRRCRTASPRAGSRARPHPAAVAGPVPRVCGCATPPPTWPHPAATAPVDLSARRSLLPSRDRRRKPTHSTRRRFAETTNQRIGRIRDLGWETSSRRRFTTPAHSIQHACISYLHVRRERLGVVPHSWAFYVAPCQTLSVRFATHFTSLMHIQRLGEA